MDGLSKESERVFFADQIEQIPGAVRQDHAVDFGMVLHGVKQVVESVTWAGLGDRREHALGIVHCAAAHGLANRFSTCPAFAQRRSFDCMKDLLLAAAFLLNPVGVPVEDFEYRKWLELLGQLQRHVERGGQRHHSMKADVVFAAERARVGQRARGYQAAKFFARFEFRRQRTEKLVSRCLLHEADERFERAKVERLGRLRPEGGSEAEIVCHGNTNCGDDHAAPHISQEFTTSAGMTIHMFPPKVGAYWDVRVWRPWIPLTPLRPQRQEG